MPKKKHDVEVYIVRIEDLWMSVYNRSRKTISLSAISRQNKSWKLVVNLCHRCEFMFDHILFNVYIQAR